MDLKLGNTIDLAKRLAQVATTGAAPPAGRWIDGRVVGVLASPAEGTAQHVAVGVSVMPAGVSAPRHVHEAEEIAIVLSGTGVIVIGEQRIDVGTGDVVRTPSNVPHTTTAGSDGPLSVLWLYAPPGSEVRWLPADPTDEETS